MRAVLYIPLCCRRARYMADELKMGLRERAVVDKWMCQVVNEDEVLEEVAQGCKVLYTAVGVYGYLIIIKNCRSWEDVEDLVYKSGGAIVYV